VPIEGVGVTVRVFDGNAVLAEPVSFEVMLKVGEAVSVGFRVMIGVGTAVSVGFRVMIIDGLALNVGVEESCTLIVGVGVIACLGS
jgi:hypothetical protein